MTSTQIKRLAARLERPAPADRECVPSIIVALTMARAAQRKDSSR
jgi:hypothetical protein